MLESFSLANYLVIILALASHYSLGRRLTLQPPLVSCLVGVSFSALVVATLANFSAGLIKPYILGSTGIFALWTILDVYNALKIRQIRLFRLASFILLIVVGLLFFKFNDPARVHFKQTNVGIYIPYNPHYTNYANLSLEMLDAEYLSRLRHRSYYPENWSTYHFFSSSVHAIGQGFISNPNLWTYFMVQTIVMILIFLSILEWYFANAPPTAYRYILILVWLTIIFNMSSVEWHFRTSMAYSVFALVFLTLSVCTAKYKDALLFCILLGGSVFRLMPVAFILGVFIVYCFIRPSWRADELKRHVRENLLLTIYFFLFLLYNVVTILVPLSMGSFQINLKLRNIYWSIGSNEQVRWVNYKLDELLSSLGVSDQFETATEHYFSALQVPGNPVSLSQGLLVTAGVIGVSAIIVVVVRVFIRYQMSDKNFSIPIMGILCAVFFFIVFNQPSPLAPGWHPMLFSYQFGGAALSYIKSIPALQITYLFGNTMLTSITMFIGGMTVILIALSQVNRCVNYFDLKKLPWRHVVFFPLLFFVTLLARFELALVMIPYVLSVPILIMLARQSTQGKLKNSQLTCAFFLWSIALAIGYQFIDSWSFGGPVLALLGDVLFMSLLLYWFSRSSPPKWSRQIIYLPLIYAFLIPYSYIFAGSVSDRLSFSRGDQSEHKQIVVLDEVSYQKELQNNLYVFEYQENQTGAFNDLYSSILGKRIPKNRKLLDEKIIQASQFLLPK